MKMPCGYCPHSTFSTEVLWLPPLAEQQPVERYVEDGVQRDQLGRVGQRFTVLDPAVLRTADKYLLEFHPCAQLLLRELQLAATQTHPGADRSRERALAGQVFFWQILHPLGHSRSKRS